MERELWPELSRAVHTLAEALPTASLEPLLSDEPAPLGHDRGPSPARLLLASVANCLVASLLFALRKQHNAPGRLRARITALRASVTNEAQTANTARIGSLRESYQAARAEEDDLRTQVARLSSSVLDQRGRRIR